MRRHRFDPLSFIFGVLFLAVAAVALIGTEVLALRDLTWIAPSLLVIAGAALLLSSARNGSDDTLEGQVPVEPPREQHARDEQHDEQSDGAPAREQARASDAPGMGRAPGER